MRRDNKTIRVFADASVLIAATLSKTGSSRVIYELAMSNKIYLILTDQVVKEARLSLKKKYGTEHLSLFYSLIGDVKESILATPEKKEIEVFTDIILDIDDRHVLAGAMRHNADVLITLDRKHFFTEKIKNAKLSFQIQLPGDFLNEYRKSLLQD